MRNSKRWRRGSRHDSPSSKSPSKRAAARSNKWNMLFASLGTLGVTMSMLFGLWAVGYQIADLIKPP
jgi:hypothetical protein